MIHTTQIRKAALAAVAFALLAVYASDARARETPQGPSKAMIQSQRLQKQAQALFENPVQWREAAAMLTQAARLRPAGDPEKQQMLAMAGRLYAYGGNTRFAQYWLERAGEEALAGGDVLGAAEAYTQAAHLACTRNDWRKARSLAQRVESLTASPLLTAEQRASILRPFAESVFASAGRS